MHLCIKHTSRQTNTLTKMQIFRQGITLEWGCKQFAETAQILHIMMGNKTIFTHIISILCELLVLVAWFTFLWWRHKRWRSAQFDPTIVTHSPTPFCLVQLFSPLVKTENCFYSKLSQPRFKLLWLTTFVKHLWSFIVTLMYLLLPNNPKISYKVTRHQPKFLTLSAMTPKQHWFERWIRFCSNIRTILHDDVLKRKRFPRYWPFVMWMHRSPVDSPHKGQWRGALMFSLIYTWINAWVNNREAGDLRYRHHRTHYDITVMKSGHNHLWMPKMTPGGDRGHNKVSQMHCRIVLRADYQR